jgi:DNA-binding response OmpR family regulator
MALCGALNRRGYLVEHARTAAEALRDRRTDLIVLDPRLPGEDGRQLYQKLRSRTDAGIVIATQRDEQRHWASDAGADHITKPFRLLELHARLQAMLRRRRPRQEHSLAVGPLRLDLDRRQALLDGMLIDLTRKEFQLLATLARTPSVVVSRERLASEVWQISRLGKSRTIDVHVATLRAKVAPLFGVESRRGIGYRLVQRAVPGVDAHLTPEWEGGKRVRGE